VIINPSASLCLFTDERVGKIWSKFWVSRCASHCRLSSPFAVHCSSSSVTSLSRLGDSASGRVSIPSTAALLTRTNYRHSESLLVISQRITSLRSRVRTLSEGHPHQVVAGVALDVDAGEGYKEQPELKNVLSIALWRRISSIRWSGSPTRTDLDRSESPVRP